MTMETSSAQWLSALGMEDPLLARQCGSGLTEEHLRLGAMMHLPSTNFDSIGTSNAMKHHNIPAMEASGFHYGIMSSESLAVMGYERPLKVPKTNNCHSTSTSAQSPNPLTFSSSSVYMPNPPLHNFQLTQHQHPLPQRLESYITSLPQLKDEKYEAVAPTTPTMQGEIMVSLASAGNDNCISDINNAMDGFNFFGGKGSNKHLAAAETGAAATAPTFNTTSKRSGHTHDHIMAERKRRERLSQRFIALSAIVPGLKKMDKASVLDDAIKYVKKLQERLNVLEQQTSKKTVQSVVYVNKSPPAQTENCPGGSVAGDDHLLPEIEARVVDKSVLIRIHCEKRKGLLVKFLGELEKLHLTVVNASILSFSETSLDLTLNAQMEEGCELTVTDIMKTLEALFKRTA